MCGSRCGQVGPGQDGQGPGYPPASCMCQVVCLSWPAPSLGSGGDPAIFRSFLLVDSELGLQLGSSLSSSESALGTAGSSWPPVKSTRPSICGTEGCLKRENRAGKRMNPAVMRIIPRTERCLILCDFEYVTCSSPVGRTSGVSAFRREGERFRKVKCPS